MYEAEWSTKGSLTDRMPPVHIDKFDREDNKYNTKDKFKFAKIIN